MKQLLSITITLLFVFTLVFITQVAETQARSHMGDDHMNDSPWGDDHMNDSPGDDDHMNDSPGDDDHMNDSPWDDDDGIPDDVDNCPAMPNGPDGGTCSAGTIGDPCMKHGDCGCEGYCSKDQEDIDEDGYGDVCDPTPTP